MPFISIELSELRADLDSMKDADEREPAARPAPASASDAQPDSAPVASPRPDA